MKQNHHIRIACITGVIILSGLTFTPLVMAPGVTEPSLGGLPRTLWVGLLVYMGIVLLTALLSRIHPEARDDEGDSV